MERGPIREAGRGWDIICKCDCAVDDGGTLYSITYRKSPIQAVITRSGVLTGKFFF